MSRRQRRRHGNRPDDASRKRATLRYAGIVAVVLAGVVGLVAFALVSTSNANFRFTMYQGEDVLGGSELKFAELFPSEKPLVLNFWAGQCPPCRAEMPGFQRVYDRYQGAFILLGLDVGPFKNLGSNQDARNLLLELGITYPTAYAHTRDPVVNYSVTSMPTTIFFTPDGKVFSKHVGFLDEQRMNARIEDLLLFSESSS